MAAEVNPTGPLSLEVCGVRLAIEADLPDVREKVAMTYAAYATPAHDGDGYGVIAVRAESKHGGVEVSDSAGRLPGECTDPSAAAALTLERVARVVTSALANRQILAVHAAGVVHRGQAALLAGPSGAGKTTLALGLVTRGMGLLSDELAIIPAGENVVLPYRRSVHIRPGTPELIPALAFLTGEPQVMLGGGIRWSVTPQQLERRLPGSLGAPAPLAHVVLIERPGDKATVPRLEPESSAISVVELARGTPASDSDLPFVLRRLGVALGTARCARLYPGPFEATLACLSGWLEA